MTSRDATRRVLPLALWLLAAGAVTSLASGSPLFAQVASARESRSCTVPEAVQARVATPPPPAEWYETRRVTGAEGDRIALGVGHIHFSERNRVADLPPGEFDWLQSIDLPLSPEPGEPPAAWITNGWVVRDGVDPEPLRRADQVETGYEEPSLVVLAMEGDWLRVRYAGDVSGSGWAPTCALDAGSVLLDFTPWSRWLTSGSLSPLFFRGDAPDALFSEPNGQSERRAIGRDYHLEPIEVRGSWMRVRLKEPSDYCEFDLESDASEGWVRWYADDVGPRLWYFTRGC